MNTAVNEEAARLETLIVARASDLIAEQAAANMNFALAHFGVVQRIDSNDPRITDAVVELAFAHDAAHKRDLAGLPDEGGFFAAAERLCARALHVVSHRIVMDAMEAHVKAAELALREAVAAFRALNRIGVAQLGEAVADDYLPAPETAALFGVGVAQ
ncbi:hypothetical protein SAMN05414139_01482 [Burkholderia sp. D7]|nr:hypothetical protein SAMN05414139_01482 [Burkholderia sp. D7]